MTGIFPAAAKVSRIIQHRIKNQRLAAVIMGNREPHPVIGGDYIPTFNQAPLAVDHLVDARLL